MNRSRNSLIGLSLLIATLITAEAGAVCKPPVYIIAHRCNGYSSVSNVVNAQGVNGVEADFRYTGGAWYASHDIVSIAVPLESWLSNVRTALTQPNSSAQSSLALVIFDIKSSDGPLGILYDRARAVLGPDLNIIFSIGNYGARNEFFDLYAQAQADRRFGLAIDYLTSGQNQTMVRDFFRSGGFPHYWYGDGYAAGLVTPQSVYDNVAAGRGLRESSCDSPAPNRSSPFHGVYTWTYENADSIKRFLDEGVNGIFVNAYECNGFAGFVNIWQPSQAVAYAKGDSGAKFATRADNPFELGPALSAPQDLTVECNGSGGVSATDPQIASWLSSAAVTNNECSSVTTTKSHPSFFPLGSTPVTFTSTSAGINMFVPILNIQVTTCSRSTTATRSVVVQDTRAPAMTCGNITRDPESPSGTVVTIRPQAVTDCRAVTTSCTLSGNLFAPGTVSYSTCTSSDGFQQSACTIQVRIRTVAEMIARLREDVERLPTDRPNARLSEAERAGLLADVDAIAQTVAGGNTACSMLAAFRAKIADYHSRELIKARDSSDLFPLIDAIKRALGCA